MNDPLNHPQPGGREPPPTPGLRLVEEFVNTSDVEAALDEVGTPAKLRDWLAARGALAAGETIDADAHARAIAIREGLRALARANNGEPLDEAQLAALNRAAAEAPLVARLGPGDWGLQPGGSGLDAFLGSVLGAALAAMADGTWSRMKACRNDVCRWLFYDYSRNRSGTWCTMAVCGSRMKARAYRARQRETMSA